MSCCAISTSPAPIRKARIGLATVGATHLLKIAVEAATGQRAKIDVFGTDYPTPDGSCIRDFIHVSDLAQAHRAALAYLRAGGASATLNCGYGRGYSVLETIEAVRRVSGRNFAVQNAARRPGDIMTMIADTSRIRAHAGLDPAIRQSRNHRRARAGVGREIVPRAQRRARNTRFRPENLVRRKACFGLKNPDIAGKETDVSQQP